MVFAFGKSGFGTPGMEKGVSVLAAGKLVIRGQRGIRSREGQTLSRRYGVDLWLPEGQKIRAS